MILTETYEYGLFSYTKLKIDLGYLECEQSEANTDSKILILKHIIQRYEEQVILPWMITFQYGTKFCKRENLVESFEQLSAWRKKPDVQLLDPEQQEKVMREWIEKLLEDYIRQKHPYVIDGSTASQPLVNYYE